MKRRVSKGSFCRESDRLRTDKGKFAEDGLGAAHRKGISFRLRRVCPLSQYAVGRLWSAADESFSVRERKIEVVPRKFCSRPRNLVSGTGVFVYPEGQQAIICEM